MRAKGGQHVTLPNGKEVYPTAQDWIVSMGAQVVDICSAKELREGYDEITDGLLLPRALCTTIEATTGVGTTKTAEALLAAVQRLARIRIGDIRIDFSPGQIEEIAHRASKRGYTVAQEMSRIVERIKDEIFYRS